MSSVSPDPSSSPSSLAELLEQLCGALELGFFNSSSSSSRRLFARQESEKDLGRSPSLERRREVKDETLVLGSTTEVLLSLLSALDQLLRRDLEEIWITLGATLVFFLNCKVKNKKNANYAKNVPGTLLTLPALSVSRSSGKSVVKQLVFAMTSLSLHIIFDYRTNERRNEHSNVKRTHSRMQERADEETNACRRYSGTPAWAKGGTSARND